MQGCFTGSQLFRLSVEEILALLFLFNALLMLLIALLCCPLAYLKSRVFRVNLDAIFLNELMKVI